MRYAILQHHSECLIEFLICCIYFRETCNHPEPK